MLRKPPLVIAAPVVLACVADAAAALGLGEIRTQAVLNQPFYAEIALTDVDAADIDNIQVRLAEQDAFARAGAERPAFLRRLRFTAALGTDARPYIQVSSAEPIREPYLNFLVEAIWPAGRLVKEYAVLLDPPGRGGPVAPRMVAPTGSAPQPRPRQGLAPAAPGSPLRQQQAAPAGAVRTPPQQAAEGRPGAGAPVAVPVPAQVRDTRFPLHHGPVRPGANLIAIARAMTPAGASVAQTALALFRNNQNAFARGNINHLRRGAHLVVPSAAALFALDRATAQRAFEQALAGRRVHDAPLTDGAGAAGPPMAAADAPPPSSPTTGATAADPRALAQPTAATGPRPRQELSLVQDTTERHRQATRALRQRVAELERRLAEIQRLLARRDGQPTQSPPAARTADAATSAAAPSAPTMPGSTGEVAGGDVADGEGGGGDVQPDAARAALVQAPPSAPLAPADSGDKAPAAAGAMTGDAEDPPAATTARVEDAGAPGAGQASTQPSTQPSTQTPAEPASWRSAPALVGGITIDMPPWALAAAGGMLLGGLGLLADRRRRQLAVGADDDGVDDDRVAGAHAGGRTSAPQSPLDAAGDACTGAAERPGGDLDGDTPAAPDPVAAFDAPQPVESCEWGADDRLGLALDDGMGRLRSPADTQPTDCDVPGFEASPASTGDIERRELRAGPRLAPPDPQAPAREPPALAALEYQPEVSVAACPAGDEGTAAGGGGPDSIPGGAPFAQWHTDAGGWDDVATKLDLARAYLDVDDPVAARALLNAVVAAGDERQRTDAEALLATLG
ncbi:FimV/HubP family polar landmark protein [uncultured Thiohalocapsa sp.]|uniref:FimV/HubP family polar landmark protein n=1 Tax=uncultured Thiohalocapsa sp. TaxID=768990 RepID=UPI0025D6EAD2|nr:FimV/HubP family polar landmark protein [uncultured Thiohalocapsa sp.]